MFCSLYCSVMIAVIVMSKTTIGIDANPTTAENPPSSTYPVIPRITPLKYRPTIVIAGNGKQHRTALVRSWTQEYQRHRATFAIIEDRPEIFPGTLNDDNLLRKALIQFANPPGKDKHEDTNAESVLIELLPNGISPSYLLAADESMPEPFPEQLVRLPLVVSGVGIGYNMPCMVPRSTLYLSRTAMIRLFLGKLTSPADEVLHLNAYKEGLTTCDKNIKMRIVMMDKPRTVAVLVLRRVFQWAKNDPLYATEAKKYDFDEIDSEKLKQTYKKYLADMKGVFILAKTSMEMIGRFLSTKHTFCIEVLARLNEFDLPVAALENDLKTVVEPQQFADAIVSTASAFYSKQAQGDGTYYKDDGQALYPFFYVIYINLKVGDADPKWKMNCEQMVEIFRFYRFIINNHRTQELSRATYNPVVPPAAYHTARRKLQEIKCHDPSNATGTIGNDIWTMMLNNITAEMNAAEEDPDQITVVTTTLVLTGLAVVFLSWRLAVFFAIANRARAGIFHIQSHDIVLAPKNLTARDRFKGAIASRRVVDHETPRSYVHTMYFGKWKTFEVMLRPCSLNIHRLTRQARWALVEMMDISAHQRVATLYGITEVANGRYFVSNFCPYGDLRTMIITKEYQFSLNIKYSLSADIAEGMSYLHSKGILHGNLRSCSIFIEADLSAKVGDWEYNRLHRLDGSYFSQETRLAKKLTLFEQTAFYPWLYWTAPEVLQSGMMGHPVKPTKQHDVYSFGIILGEIFGDESAFQRYQDTPFNFTPTEILTKVLSSNLRPRLTPNHNVPTSIHRLMDYCWSASPRARPSFADVGRVLKCAVSRRKPFSDLVVIEAQVMADQIKRRAMKLEDELQKVSDELHRFTHCTLPFPIWRSVYLTQERPALGRFDDVIILRCTLVNVDAIMAAGAQNCQVVIETINLLHKIFSELVQDNGRIYRLHWEGATVVAVGGAPCGLHLDPIHSICQIAIELILWSLSARTPGMETLQFRLAIHSDSAAAGCIEYSSPHYVVFGSVMKIAANIERASQPSKILVSDEFNHRLQKLAKVYVKYRTAPAKVQVRGFRKECFWLLGSDYCEEQFALDEVLYGKGVPEAAFKDESSSTSRPRAALPPFDSSFVERCTAKSASHPVLRDTAALLRSLKRQRVDIMKVPSQRVLDDQIYSERRSREEDEKNKRLKMFLPASARSTEDPIEHWQTRTDRLSILDATHHTKHHEPTHRKQSAEASQFDAILGSIMHSHHLDGPETITSERSSIGLPRRSMTYMEQILEDAPVEPNEPAMNLIIDHRAVRKRNTHTLDEEHGAVSSHVIAQPDNDSKREDQPRQKDEMIRPKMHDSAFDIPSASSIHSVLPHVHEIAHTTPSKIHHRYETWHLGSIDGDSEEFHDDKRDELHHRLRIHNTSLESIANHHHQTSDETALEFAEEIEENLPAALIENIHELLQQQAATDDDGPSTSDEIVKELKIAKKVGFQALAVPPEPIKQLPSTSTSTKTGSTVRTVTTSLRPTKTKRNPSKERASNQPPTKLKTKDKNTKKATELPKK